MKQDLVVGVIGMLILTVVLAVVDFIWKKNVLLKSIVFLFTLPKRVWKMYNNWRYWRCYHPLFSKIVVTPIKITRLKDGYYLISTEVTLHCKNRDEVNTLYLDFSNILINVHSRVKGRKVSYDLIPSEGNLNWHLMPGASTTKVGDLKHKLKAISPARPKLEGIVICKVKSIGMVSLKTIKRNLRLPNFEVAVDWGVKDEV